MVVEKKSKARERQKLVAEEFERWLKAHPKARMDEKVKQLNYISDMAYTGES